MSIRCRPPRGTSAPGCHRSGSPRRESRPRPGRRSRRTPSGDRAPVLTGADQELVGPLERRRPSRPAAPARWCRPRRRRRRPPDLAAGVVEAATPPGFSVISRPWPPPGRGRKPASTSSCLDGSTVADGRGPCVQPRHGGHRRRSARQRGSVAGRTTSSVAPPSACEVSSMVPPRSAPGPRAAAARSDPSARRRVRRRPSRRPTGRYETIPPRSTTVTTTRWASACFSTLRSPSRTTR